MKKEIVVLLLIVSIGSLLFPFLTLAGDYEGYGGTVHYEGLVPCGKSEKSPGESDGVTKSCQFCHLFVMLDGIIDFVTQKIVPPIVVLMIIIAGIMFFFGGGNPSLLLQAKKLITSVVMGLVIMFSAFLIIQTILNVMGVADTNPLHSWLTGNAFTIECPI
jgi:type IV secretory pathway VirB2 component (pilin)